MTRTELDNMSKHDLAEQIKYCETMQRFYTVASRKPVWNQDIKILKTELAARA